jgi:two-component system sensor kinase FixL
LHVLESTSLPPNVSVSADIPADLPDVLVDENQVPIVFRNLVRNARDAMPDGGTITVRAKAEGERLEVSVQDEGMGISPDELDRIMEPLYSTKSRGMGLGLAITRAILKKNQGEIAVQSELGVGTVFSVNFRTA